MSSNAPKTHEEQVRLVEDTPRRMDEIIRESLAAIARGDYEEITLEEMEEADRK